MTGDIWGELRAACEPVSKDIRHGMGLPHQSSARRLTRALNAFELSPEPEAREACRYTVARVWYDMRDGLSPRLRDFYLDALLAQASVWWLEGLSDAQIGGRMGVSPERIIFDRELADAQAAGAFELWSLRPVPRLGRAAEFVTTKCAEAVRLEWAGGAEEEYKSLAAAMRRHGWQSIAPTCFAIKIKGGVR